MARARSRKPQTGKETTQSLPEVSDLGIISDQILGEPQVESDVALHEQVTETSNTTNNTTGERIHKMALTPDQINALLGQSRTKGQYIKRLTDFMESGEGGVDVAETWPEFTDKKPNTLKQGFENAKNSKNAPTGSDNVSVLVNDERVFLINLAAAGVTVDGTEEAAA